MSIFLLRILKGGAEALPLWWINRYCPILPVSVPSKTKTYLYSMGCRGNPFSPFVFNKLRRDYADILSDRMALGRGRRAERRSAGDVGGAAAESPPIEMVDGNSTEAERRSALHVRLRLHRRASRSTCVLAGWRRPLPGYCGLPGIE